MDVKYILWNESNELRSGWQIGLFIVAFAGTSLVFVVPLVMLLKLNDPMVLNAAVLASAVAATWIVTRFVNKKPFVAVGMSINKHTMRELLLGCTLGWLMLTAIFGVEYLSGYVKVVAAEVTFLEGVRMFLTACLFFALAAMTEELLFRGYPFQTLVRGIGFVPSVVATGMVFGIAHLGNPHSSIFAFINTVLVAGVFCLAYWRTRSLWIPFGIHFGWNFSQTTVYGFPTSGIHFSQFELTRLTQFGPEWTTGGAYGPEAGAIATVVILLCGMYIYFSRSLRPHPECMTLERDNEVIKFPLLERRQAA